jgi:hypothetical protein
LVEFGVFVDDVCAYAHVAPPTVRAPARTAPLTRSLGFTPMWFLSLGEHSWNRTNTAVDFEECENDVRSR